MKKTMTALELSHPILAAKHSNPGLANFSHDPDFDGFALREGRLLLARSCTGVR